MYGTGICCVPSWRSMLTGLYIDKLATGNISATTSPIANAATTQAHHVREVAVFQVKVITQPFTYIAHAVEAEMFVVSRYRVVSHTKAAAVSEVVAVQLIGVF